MTRQASFWSDFLLADTVLNVVNWARKSGTLYRRRLPFFPQRLRCVDMKWGRPDGRYIFSQVGRDRPTYNLVGMVYSAGGQAKDV